MTEETVTVDIYRLDNLKEAGLVGILEALQQSQPTFAIWEKLDDVCFPEVGELLPLAEWEQGRFFNEYLELCWTGGEDSYQVLLTVDAGGEMPTGDWNEPERHTWLAERRAIYMWGEGDFQIGRQMAYRPIPPTGQPNERPKAVLIAYHDPTTYRLCHYRYKGLERGT